MATQTEIDFSYTTMDKIWRLSVGEMADFTGAKYDGDFSLSLEEAQRRKHQFITDRLNVEPGNNVLDIGCGWGPVLDHLRQVDAHGIGITLSEGQYLSCLNQGFDIHLCNYRDLNRDRFGQF